MSEMLKPAMTMFEAGEARAAATGRQLAAEARCILRQGTVLTKQGNPEAGIEKIDDAIKKLVRLDDEILLGLAEEKRALAMAESGAEKKALDSLYTVRNRIGTGSPLRMVQSDVAIAGLLGRVGLIDDAVGHVQAALDKAEEFGFGHQAQKARGTYERLTGTLPVQPVPKSRFEPISE
jgi:hypothetical protein